MHSVRAILNSTLGGLMIKTTLLMQNKAVLVAPFVESAFFQLGNQMNSMASMVESQSLSFY
jgi:hypothetical protein